MNLQLNPNYLRIKSSKDWRNENIPQNQKPEGLRRIRSFRRVRKELERLKLSNVVAMRGRDRSQRNQTKAFVSLHHRRWNRNYEYLLRYTWPFLGETKGKLVKLRAEPAPSKQTIIWAGLLWLFVDEYCSQNN